LEFQDKEKNPKSTLMTVSLETKYFSEETKKKIYEADARLKMLAELAAKHRALNGPTESDKMDVDEAAPEEEETDEKASPAVNKKRKRDEVTAPAPVAPAPKAAAPKAAAPKVAALPPAPVPKAAPKAAASVPTAAAKKQAQDGKKSLLQQKAEQTKQAKKAAAAAPADSDDEDGDDDDSDDEGQETPSKKLKTENGAAASGLKMPKKPAAGADQATIEAW
jgi:hypothetical protein